MRVLIQPSTNGNITTSPLTPPYLSNVWTKKKNYYDKVSLYQGVMSFKNYVSDLFSRDYNTIQTSMTTNNGRKQTASNDMGYDPIFHCSANDFSIDDTIVLTTLTTEHNEILNDPNISNNTTSNNIWISTLFSKKNIPDIKPSNNFILIHDSDDNKQIGIHESDTLNGYSYGGVNNTTNIKPDWYSMIHSKVSFKHIGNLHKDNKLTINFACMLYRHVIIHMLLNFVLHCRFLWL
jgi:hypothetical protein